MENHSEGFACSASEYAHTMRLIEDLQIVLGLPEFKVSTKSLENVGEEDVIRAKEHLDELNKRFEAQKNQCEDDFIRVKSKVEQIRQHENLALGYTLGSKDVVDALMGLIKALDTREIERKYRMKDAIIRMREELQLMWQDCIIEVDKSEIFAEFESEVFDESIFLKHQHEVHKWQKYHQKNNFLREKLESRENKWNKLLKLEEKFHDPERLKNRGGSLLQDQVLLKRLLKDIPKIENELVELAEEFEELYGKKVKIFGQDVESFIQDAWDSFRSKKPLTLRNVKMPRAPSSKRINTLGHPRINKALGSSNCSISSLQSASTLSLNR